MPCVSIIIPVYNVEKYLSRCLDSVLDQTFANFECIMVDDGSPDNCPAVCDEYLERDIRFKVIHKKQNEGLPQARKTGFEMARGEYILFVDSDDWIEPDMVEKMYNKAIADKLDVVWCDYYLVSKKSISYNKQEIDELDKIIIIKQYFTFKLSSSVCNKLVLRKIYQHVIFPFKNVAEDQVITIQLLYYAERIGYLNKALYYYYFNPMSLTYNKRKIIDRKNDRYCNLCLIIKFLQDKFGDNIIMLEPELSNRVNQVKISYIQFNKARDIKMLFELYPNSQNFIFNKESKLSYVQKIILYLAVKNILFPLNLLDILHPLIKKVWNR